MSREYRQIPPGSVPTVALLLTMLSSLIGGNGSKTRSAARLTRPLVTPTLRYTSEEYVPGRSHKVRCAACIFSLAILAS